MNKKEEKFKQNIKDTIGMGIHYGLGHHCESTEAGDAWVLIKDMPDEEWSELIGRVTDQVLRECSENKDLLPDLD